MNQTCWDKTHKSYELAQWVYQSGEELIEAYTTYTTDFVFFIFLFYFILFFIFLNNNKANWDLNSIKQ